jgi:hypothetical protein
VSADGCFRDSGGRAWAAIDRPPKRQSFPAREAIREGELAGEQLVRFPQIIGAPMVVTLLWTTLFDKFAPLDSRGLFQAYLDLVFGPPAPKDKHPKRTRRPGWRRIES